MEDPIISQEWITSLEQFHLPRWEELHDFEIYMDQLITIVSQYVAIFQDKEGSMITASMINNYVKAKIMPRPLKKKYNKVHIAYALAITILKEVLTISEIRDGIEIQSERSGLKGAYHIFCDELELATSTVAKALKSGTLPFEELVIASDKMAMKLCTFSLISKLITRKMVAKSMQLKRLGEQGSADSVE